MGSTTNNTNCKDSGTVAVNPFLLPQYEFGMLLGKDDFDTGLGYHLGKTRLHNAWLHREGVVWGFGVEPALDRNEIVVHPGLALGRAGHELHLEVDACVNVPAWLEKHKNDAGLKLTPDPGNDKRQSFDAHVVIRYRNCLTRPVPSIVEPCGDPASAGGVAYSRIFETVEILLLPGLPAPAAPDPYHRLRLLFGFETAAAGNAADDAVVATRDAVLALPAQDQPGAWLRAFRAMAAADALDLRPASDADGVRLLFPAPEDDTLLLAEFHGIVVETSGGKTTLIKADADTSTRPSHVATRTIQELLHGPWNAASAGDGPRIDAAAVKVEDSQITLVATKDLADGSVAPEAFSITYFTAGWHDAGLSGSPSIAADHKTITVKLTAPLPAQCVVRIIARGTGPRPLLGANQVPLAGTVNGPGGTVNDGRDFVLQVRRGS